jgi:cobalt-zinc-cadmium efflux system protein
VLSDAVHDLGDSLALAIAYIMERMAAKRSNAKYSYGYRRISLLSALITCGFLIAAATGVMIQAIPRLVNPVRPNVEGMMLLAVLGVAVNGYGAYRLHKGKTMNERVVSWHLIEDLVGWVAVMIGAVVMHFVDAPIIDPILSIGFTLFILYRVLGSLRHTLGLFLQAAPEGVDLEGLKKDVAALAGVRGTHDTHMWSLDGESHVLTLHVVVDAAMTIQQAEALKGDVRRLAARMGRVHVTVEVESELENCAAVDCVQ